MSIKDVKTRVRSPLRGASPVLVVTAVVVALLAIIPVGFVVYSVFDAGWERARKLIFRARVGELLLNTGLLVIFTMVGCAVLGTGCAYLVERTAVPGRRIWAPLLVAPLAIPAFVTSYGWVSVVPGIDGLSGATLIMTLAYFPLVYLPVTAALRSSDPTWEEQARSLGCGPVRTFAKVTLPQLRPALLGGSLLVGLHTLAEFGAFQSLRFSTFTTAIYEQYQSTFASAAGNMLSVVLVLCCLLLVSGEMALGRTKITRLGSGSPRPYVPVQLRGQVVPALGALLLVVIGALGVPLTSVARWLIIGGSRIWTDEVWSAALSTAQLALIAGFVTTVLAFPAAYLSVRHRGLLSIAVERVGYISAAVPSLVVGLALITLTVHYAKPIYQTAVTLILAYLLLMLPRALVPIRSGLAQSRPELEEASAALGRSRLRTLATVTIPLTAPGIATAAAFVALATSTELTATLLLGPTGLRTLATRFWSLTGSIDYVAAAPYATLLILMAIPVTYLLLHQSRKVLGR